MAKKEVTSLFLTLRNPLDVKTIGIVNKLATKQERSPHDMARRLIEAGVKAMEEKNER